MTQQKYISCPDCQSAILIDPQLLLQGIRFSCSGCSASIGLAAESHTILAQTIEKLGDLKSKVLANQDNVSHLPKNSNYYD
jgi:transcription initiation factor IIE alpha subunit